MNDEQNGGDLSEEAISRLDREQIAAYIRQKQVQLDMAYIGLEAVARVVVRILDELIQGVTNVSAALAAQHPGYARADLILNRDRLLEAAQQARINRGDREGKILLGLPKPGDAAAHADWLRTVAAVDDNCEWLVGACGYGIARQDALRTVAAEVAAALSSIDQPEAQACATRLREVVRMVVPLNKGVRDA